jgi:hypothetical protein
VPGEVTEVLPPPEHPRRKETAINAAIVATLNAYSGFLFINTTASDLSENKIETGIEII